MVQYCPLAMSNFQKGPEFKLPCRNFKGHHMANSGGFPFMKLAQRVQKVRTLQRVSYRDAVA